MMLYGPDGERIQRRVDMSSSRMRWLVDAVKAFDYPDLMTPLRFYCKLCAQGKQPDAMTVTKIPGGWKLKCGCRERVVTKLQAMRMADLDAVLQRQAMGLCCASCREQGLLDGMEAQQMEDGSTEVRCGCTVRVWRPSTQLVH